MGVNLHVDLETLQLIQGPGQRSAVSSLRFKRGDTARLNVVFLENGVTPVTIGDPGALEIQIGIKPRNQFDRSYLAHSTEWLMPSEGDDTPAYECALSFNTLPLNSALNIGSATAEELAEIILMGEISWTVGEGELTSTRTFQVIVENDVNRGTEGVPVAADPPYPSPLAIALLDQVVRFDAGQSLTLPQQAQARSNIGIIDGLESANYTNDVYKRSDSGVVPGSIAVITGEANRVEQYMGPVQPANNDLLIVTIGGVPYALTTTYPGVSSTWVADIGGGSALVLYTGVKWYANGSLTGGVEQASANKPAHPADADWSGTLIQSVKRAVGPSHPDNWAVLRNSVFLTVTATGTNYLINNVPLINGTIAVGWVDPHKIPIRHASSNGSPVLNRIYASGYTSDSDWTYMLTPSVSSAGTTFSLPYAVPPRSSVSLRLS